MNNILCTPTEIQKIDKIINRYDIFLVDIIGVVHNGVSPFEQAILCLKELQKHKKVVFISNIPRPGEIAVKKLIAMGLCPDTQIFTSGDAVRFDLQNEFLGKKVYHLGQERNTDLCTGMPIKLCANAEEAEIVIISQFIEKNEHLDQFDPILKKIVDLKLPVICSNPDLIAAQGETVRYCAGTFAKRLEKIGGNITYYGKPCRSFYDSVGQQYYISPENKCRVLMIGDTLETDILGAQTYGIDSLLVLSGNTGSEIKLSGQSVANYLKARICPNWYIKQLQN